MKSGIVVLFGLTSFLASSLLFSVEPMIGKMVLPVFGGTPAVWNTCLVYFQVVLLGGYLLARGAATADTIGPRRGAWVYLVMLALLLVTGTLVQPIAVASDLGRRMSLNASPALALLGILFQKATIPLVLVSATAPLAQHWFTRTGHPRADDPYFLYAASNSGSLIALPAYPFLIEPNFGLTAQSHVWRSGFVVLAILVITCGMVARRRGPPRGVEAVDSTPQSPPALATRIGWLTLVFLPSSWLMGVTGYLTTELAAIPLLWTIPLALYLLSFIIAFAPAAAGVVRACSRALPWVILPLALVMSAGFAHAVWIPLHLLAFFIGSVACHGALVRLRPAARHLGTFYVHIAIGGLLGGIFNALVAPVVFDRVIEYPLAVVLACLVEPAADLRLIHINVRDCIGDLVLAGIVWVLTAALATNRAGLADSGLGVLAVMVASGLGLYSCITARGRPTRFALVVLAVMVASALNTGVSGRLLHIERNFFGVVRVTQDDGRDVHRLFHGNTLHGQQSLDPALRREPLTYYTRSGPVGQVFQAMQPKWEQHDTRVAIVGLGAGTLASYARTRERWSFYEIDAAMVRIARDPHYFTYLADSRAEAIDIVLGDARLQLADAPAHTFSLIVLDAFSSDAVPVHLISREAIRLYRDKLSNDGVLAFNLSNRYLDLAPIMARQAEDAGLSYRVRYDLDLSDEEKAAGKQASSWAVMSATEGDLGSLAADPRWVRGRPRRGSAVWTDDYSDLASYVLLTPGRVWRR